MAENPFANVLGESGELPSNTAAPHPVSPAKSGKPKFKGTVSLRRETKGRGGKSVCVVYDFPRGHVSSQLKPILKHLQKATSTGGSVKGDTIEIQGEQMEQVKAVLTDMGFRPVQRGG